MRVYYVMTEDVTLRHLPCCGCMSLDPEMVFLRARSRYSLIHLGVMAILFTAAFLGVSFVPLDLLWRIGYAVTASWTVLAGFFISKWWINRRLRELRHRLWPDR